MVSNSKVSNAFTLVELILVIVLLGILSAFAVPKFIGLTKEAKQAQAQGVFGAFKVAVNLAHTQWFAKGKPNQIIIQGKAIAMSPSGYPGHIGDLNSNYCMTLWNHLMDTSGGLATTDQDAAEGKYFVHGDGYHCSYHQTGNSSALYYFPSRKADPIRAVP